MPVVLLLSLFLLSQDKPQEKCTISGTVVNYATGEPLGKVQIETETVGSPGSETSTISDVSGHFILTDLEPGQYRIKGKRNRFLKTYYGARRAESSGIPIVVEAGQKITDIKFRMMPFAVIAGTVRDPDGEPLTGIAVMALHVRFVNGRRKITEGDSAYTDETGRYRITGLTPGRYYVRADPRRRMAGAIDYGVLSFSSVTLRAADPRSLQREVPVLLPALYPGVEDPQSARTVDVEVGGRLNGVDIGLSHSGTVAVKGRVDSPAGVRAGMVTLSRGDWMGKSIGLHLTISPDEDGNFNFAAVPQGSYTLSAIANMVPEAPGVAEGSTVTLASLRQYQGQVPVSVGTSSVEGVHVMVKEEAQTSGRVVQADDEEPIANGRIAFDDRISEILYADIHEGSFLLSLPQGHYNFWLDLGRNQEVRPLIIRRAMLNGRDVATGGFAISGSEKVLLQISVAPDGGELEGTVLDREDTPVAGAIVVLIPEPMFRSHHNRYFEMETDQYGHFEIHGVVPGTYKAFAWEDVEDGIWHDPDYVKSIESKGEAVTLKTGAHESIKLHVIPIATP
jgi:protocatechuate 3,4-dioxygenase beta subunit